MEVTKAKIIIQVHTGDKFFVVDPGSYFLENPGRGEMGGNLSQDRRQGPGSGKTTKRAGR